MLLRSITEHVKSQNWLAVGIDFVIVVFGVFIGIQVSDWNDNRKTVARAAVLTERLIADFRREAWNVAFVYQYNADVLAIAERTLRLLTADAEASNRDLLIYAFRASQFSRFTQNRGTYDELVATGGIGLIADDELRKLAEYYFNTRLFDDIQNTGIQSRYREIYRETTPRLIHREIREKCGDGANDGDVAGDFSSLKIVLDFECAPELPTATIDVAAAALRNNTAIVPALRLRIATLETELADIRGIFADTLLARFGGGWKPEVET